MSGKNTHTHGISDAEVSAESSINYGDLIEATEGFALAMSSAILSGAERDTRAKVLNDPIISTERPMTYHPVTLPPDGPPVPLFKPKQYHHTASQRFVDHIARHSDQKRKPPIGQFTVLDVGEGHCRYAVTDDGPHFFCGEVAPSGPYCGEHTLLCVTGKVSAGEKAMAAAYWRTFGKVGA